MMRKKRVSNELPKTINMLYWHSMTWAYKQYLFTAATYKAITWKNEQHIGAKYSGAHHKLIYMYILVGLFRNMDIHRHVERVTH